MTRQNGNPKLRETEKPGAGMLLSLSERAMITKKSENTKIRKLTDSDNLKPEPKPNEHLTAPEQASDR